MLSLTTTARLVRSQARGVSAGFCSMNAPAAMAPAGHVILNSHTMSDKPRTYSLTDNNQDSDIHSYLAECLSFAIDDYDFQRNFLVLLDDKNSNNTSISSSPETSTESTTSKTQKPSKQNIDAQPLPKTIQEALRQASRAIVITEAKKPYIVFDVNRTWEKLCGYSFVESKGKTLGSLLRGEATDQLAATSLITHLLQGEEAGAILTNYTKSGRRFRNRIRVGPIMDESNNQITHFVGVLQEIDE